MVVTPVVMRLAAGQPVLVGGFIMLTVVWTRTDLGRVLINRDWSQRPDQVRFGPLCGLKSDISQGPRSATRRHMQCSKNGYPITSSARSVSAGFRYLAR